MMAYYVLYKNSVKNTVLYRIGVFYFLLIMDIIFLRNFRAKTRIGIYPWERKVAQTIQLDLEIALPNKRAAINDCIEDAMDYAQIAQSIHVILAEHNFSLLEALAEHIAQTIMLQYEAPWVKVSVAKLGIVRDVEKIGICIERGIREKIGCNGE
ncbi:dihydroneopterin aldolase [Nitrosomonas marina]|uniref:Dihydroneopterin aldolase n=2 Tax=Nitrosomonas marina TaxID=917 RepID=A0A1H8G612_9PROT|nr:dihydroneopterin aldolase [Nitrosomonas marina]